MIPIPRQGIFWGVVEQEPPTGPFLLMVNDEILAQFEDETQALLSVWIMGFSYKQLLVLFPQYKSIHNIRNFIFPTNIDNIIKMRRDYNPRQLVDREYLQIVKLAGFPNSKLSPYIYSQYYKFISGQKIKPDWIESDSIKMLNKKIMEYKSKIKEYCDSREIKINYELLEEYGVPHDKTFIMAIYLDENEMGHGKGRNKKEAEQSAAKAAMRNLELIW